MYWEELGFLLSISTNQILKSCLRHGVSVRLPASRVICGKGLLAANPQTVSCDIRLMLGCEWAVIFPAVTSFTVCRLEHSSTLPHKAQSLYCSAASQRGMTHVKQDPDSSVQKSLANPNIFIFPIFLKEPEFVVTSSARLVKSLLKFFFGQPQNIFR